jgi:uncharacterized protein (DUF433 family)
MNKQSAMEMVNDHLGYRLLNQRNTSLANVNASKAVWWLNINPDRFGNDLHLLLVKEGQDGLVWLKIEADTFPALGKVFRKRQDNGLIDLEISSGNQQYMTDVKSGGTGYNFAKHIEHEWKLTVESVKSDRVIHNDEGVNDMTTKIVVHTDQPWEGDRTSWFAKTRQDTGELFRHLATGRTLASFLNENPSVGKVWVMSALYMAHQVLEEVAYRAPNLLVHSDRDIMGGKPVFVGTRLPVEILFEYLKDNFTLSEFADDFPPGDVEQSAKALTLAGEILIKESREREAWENETHVAPAA